MADAVGSWTAMSNSNEKIHLTECTMIFNRSFDSEAVKHVILIHMVNGCIKARTCVGSDRNGGENTGGTKSGSCTALDVNNAGGHMLNASSHEMACASDHDEAESGGKV